MKHIVIALLMLTLASCSKEKKLVNKLEGTWEIEKMFLDGEQMILSNSTIKFDDCDDTEDCDGSLYLYFTEDGEGNLLNFSYDVEDKGEGMKMMFDDFDGSNVDWDLEVDLEDDELTLKGTGIETYDGDSYSYQVNIELKKDN